VGREAQVSGSGRQEFQLANGRLLYVYADDLAVQQADGRFKVMARARDLGAQLRQLVSSEKGR
jgi:hypothetical protein